MYVGSAIEPICTAGKTATKIAHFNYFQILVGGTSNFAYALHKSFVDSQGFSMSV